MIVTFNFTHQTKDLKYLISFNDKFVSVYDINNRTVVNKRIKPAYKSDTYKTTPYFCITSPWREHYELKDLIKLED